MRPPPPRGNPEWEAARRTAPSLPCAGTMTLMSDHSDEARKARAAARRDWPVRKFRLGHEPGDDLSATTTAEERLAMMWPLAMEAWTLAGRPIPDYERRNAPIRVIRPPASRTNT